MECTCCNSPPNTKTASSPDLGTIGRSNTPAESTTSSVIFDKISTILERKKVNLFADYSMKTGSVQFIKHVPVRLTRSRLSCTDISDCSSNSCIHIQHVPQRRESFLYKYERDSFISPERVSLLQTSIPPGENNVQECVEDIIVTPFAQILAILRRIRLNVSEMAKENPINSVEKEDSGEKKIGKTLPIDMPTEETMKMLDWCLENLENIKTDRSVSDLAMVKFEKMLNFELNQYDMEFPNDHQISNYICNTFLEDRLDVEESIPDYTSLSVSCRNSIISDGVNVKQDYKEDKESSLIKSPWIHDPQIQKDLGKCINNWAIDIFDIHSKCNNVLTLVAYTIFKERYIMETFQIPSDLLLNFLMKIEATYRRLPYHNSIHAADVLQTANVMLNSKALQNVFTDLEIFAVLFACTVHDVDHPGVTNQFLINTCDPLATLYNDQSILENHHLATSFSLLKDKQYDILLHLTKPERSTFRKLVIDMVLASDMSRHMNLLADLKTMIETKKVSGSGLLNMDKYNDRVTILQNLVHCADISNPTKPFQIYEVWVDRILGELFLQGDKEREMGLDISAMCDRENVAVEKTQIGFIDYIVHPLWESWNELVYPEAQIMLDTLANNRQHYCSRISLTQTINELDDEEIEEDLEFRMDNH